MKNFLKKTADGVIVLLGIGQTVYTIYKVSELVVKHKLKKSLNKSIDNAEKINKEYSDIYQSRVDEVSKRDDLTQVQKEAKLYRYSVATDKYFRDIYAGKKEAYENVLWEIENDL